MIEKMKRVKWFLIQESWDLPPLQGNHDPQVLRARKERAL